MSNKIKQKKGFTIIEVVLVLAIAGLIFLMVFFVLPQAMAGQRDTERRQAMSRVQSALVQYQTNNKSKRNNLPGPGAIAFSDSDEGFGECTSSACTFIRNYLNTTDSVAANQNLFVDPDGVAYNMVITENWASSSSGISTTSASGLQDLSSLDIQGTDSNQYITIKGDDPLKAHVIYIIPGAKCDGENAVKSELRHFAVLYRLENSSIYCGDSD
ncbi:type II secretion system protein [Candidatus Saccharibacteria bacterium]|nr:type II secretion system protein [Candidatus Saccharibacteria bacterium]